MATTIPCRVRRFAQPHAFGPHPAGSIVHVEPEHLNDPTIRAALITLDEEEAAKRAEDARIQKETEDRFATAERERKAAIEASQAAREADRKRQKAARDVAAGE